MKRYKTQKVEYQDHYNNVKDMKVFLNGKFCVSDSLEGLSEYYLYDVYFIYYYKIYR